jgi:hypothetical protein
MNICFFLLPIALLVIPNIIGALLEKFDIPIPDWYYKFVSFARRAAIYLVGVFLGVMILGRALPSTFPGSIILDRIEKYGLNKTDSAKALLSHYEISDEELMEIIQEKDIDFKKSEKTKKPWPVYYFKGENKYDKKLEFWVEVPDTMKSTLIRVRLIEK